MDANNRAGGAFDPVEACVEALCLKGCRSVYETIARLECGETLSETLGLSHAECRLVLAELKAIMAVYGETSVCPPPPAVGG